MAYGKHIKIISKWLEIQDMKVVFVTPLVQRLSDGKS